MSIDTLTASHSFTLVRPNFALSNLICPLIPLSYYFFLARCAAYVYYASFSKSALIFAYKATSFSLSTRSNSSCFLRYALYFFFSYYNFFSLYSYCNFFSFCSYYSLFAYYSFFSYYSFNSFFGNFYSFFVVFGSVFLNFLSSILLLSSKVFDSSISLAASSYSFTSVLFYSLFSA